MPKKIAIVGRPKVGKTTLANKLAKELDIALFHTDDSIGKVSFTDAHNHWIEQLRDKESYIVEGVQVSRMLRKGHSEGSWKPDKLIIVDASHPVKSKHRGLASLCKDPVEQWCEANPDVEVERVRNDFELPREGYMSAARRKVDDDI